MKTKIILASTSVYRRQLLERLGLPFEVAKPDMNEQALAGETAAETAERLAAGKALSLRHLFPTALIIGSDQVAELDGLHIGKPGSLERATEQLKQLRAKTLIFHTGVALFNTQTGRIQSKVVPTTVEFRNYSEHDIAHYLQREPAIDCAGSAKSEGLGAALMKRMQSDDPTALIGLPLLTIVDMLEAEGIGVLS